MSASSVSIPQPGVRREVIPFLNVAELNQSIGTELNEAIQRVLFSGDLAGGRFVQSFERRFADYCSTQFASGVGSGTEALWLVLRALGVGPGDEVITVPNSFFATAEAISMTGARPVFVDVDEDTCLMNPSLIEAALSERTRAIVPVHLFGQMAPMREICRVAERHGLWVVEDASQAHGAEQGVQRAGSLGHAGCFSFYPTKNLGACGDAGAVVTNLPELDARVKMLRDHGQLTKHCHQVVGWNCRMDGIQAEILRLKLRHLDLWNERRRVAAKLYDRFLGGLPGIQTPKAGPDNKHVHHLYVVQTDHREAVEQALRKQNIGFGIHYPTPIHRQPAYQDLGFEEGSFPVAERLSQRILSLPLSPIATVEEIAAVSAAVTDGVRAKMEV